MKKRTLGKTNINVSEIGLGTWQVGGVWGSRFNAYNAKLLLRAAIENGVNFIDTADVYSDGLSEKAVGEVLKSYPNEEIFVATKCGRKLRPHSDASYSVESLRKCVEDSLSNMKIGCIDLIQLHCIPDETYDRPEIFELFDRLKEEGKIKNLGVSVEKVDQALKAIRYDNVSTVQIIYNMFRHRPSEVFFEKAKEQNVGIIARVPLASGLLSGKYSENTVFHKGDHRKENVNGEQFDKGETFSGVDYSTALKAVSKFKKHFEGKKLAQVALRWILQNDAVSTVIPGASKLKHLESNLEADNLGNLSQDDLDLVMSVYESDIKQEVHHLW